MVRRNQGLTLDEWALADMLRITRVCAELGQHTEKAEKGLTAYKAMRDKTMNGLVQTQAKADLTRKLMDFISEKDKNPQVDPPLSTMSLGPGM